jgi:hypothetical protein
MYMAAQAVLGKQLLRQNELLETDLSMYWQLQLAVTLPKQPESKEQELHRDGDLRWMFFFSIAVVDYPQV